MIACKKKTKNAPGELQLLSEKMRFSCFYLVQERILHKNLNQSFCYKRKIIHCSMRVVYLNHNIKSKSGGVATIYPSLIGGI